jgi:colicin import membrane protein
VPIGLIVSLLLHGMLLGWALLAVIRTPPLDIPKPEPVEVAIVTEGDLVRLKQGDRDAKTLEAEGKEGPAKEPPKKDPPKPTPPPPPQAAAPPPPPPEPPKVEPPKPDPIAEQLAQPEPPKPEPPKPEPPKVEPKPADPIGDLAAQAAKEPPPPPKQPPPPKAPPKQPVKPPPPPPKKQDLAALVNDALKTTAEKSAPPAPTKALIDRRAQPAPAAGQKTASANRGPSAGAPEGTDTVLTADKLSMLGLLMRNNVKRCWNINAGMEGANRLVIKAQIKLSQDGRLIGDPVIVNTSAGPQFEDAANSAKRALIECQPYTNLPPELYVGGWDFMAITFDPSKMF